MSFTSSHSRSPDAHANSPSVSSAVCSSTREPTGPLYGAYFATRVATAGGGYSARSPVSNARVTRNGTVENSQRMSVQYDGMAMLAPARRICANRCRARSSMAYDEALAERIRPLVDARGEVTERKMFGGITWMLQGNMAWACWVMTCACG